MIYGDRIRLVAIEKEDLPLFVEWLNDPEVRHGIDLYLPMSLAQEEKWFEKMLERSPDTQPLTIEVREGNRWVKIGNMGLFQFNPRARSAEIGIMIGNKEYWNQGYGTEATTLMLIHGFETLNLHRVMLRVYEDNQRAIRCYEKVGFVHEGRMREAHYSDGVYRDIIIMGVIRSEWEDGEKVKGKEKD
ncbi:MAG: GNAT family N-acetyltransferase [Aliifodinibius sp.]|nr:GNAT family N-acetyltransferase [Fodinibius sp.]